MSKGSKAAKIVNPYEKGRMQRVEECKARLLEPGILDIGRSLTNLVDSKKNRKRKKKANGSEEENKDPDYSPENQSAGEEDQEDEGQSSNHAKATKKLKKNAEQHLEHQDEGSATEVVREMVRKPVEERSTSVVRKPVTRSNAPSQKFVPPMMLHKLSKQQRQGKGKAPTVAQLILKKKQPEKEAAAKTQTPLAAGCPENQLVTDADLQWLSELDERFHVNGDEEDKTDEEPENPDNDDESATKGNGEDADDSDNDELYDSDNEELDDNEGEDGNINEPELPLSKMVVQGATRRGPTMMHAVHMRPLEQREVIILNEFGQPVGPVTPEKDTAKEFSRFLGTIARDYNNAPLIYRTWRKVPNKDKLWEYVLSKYIVPEEGKDWVLKSIGAAWRIHKCRFKKKHFHKYTTNKLRWVNRPKTVTDGDFKDLLILWNNKDEKARCARNQSRRKAQKNNHTAGSKSFARIREEMKNEDPNKELPSLADVFERTRKRDEKKKYVDTYEDTARKIEAMKSYQPPEDGSGPKDAFLGVMGNDYPGRRRLFGREVTNKVLNKSAIAAGSYVLPKEIMDAVRADMDSEKNEIVDIRKELEADYEQKKANLEADYAKKMEEFEKSKEDLVQEVLEKLIAKLPTDVVRQCLA